MIKLSKADKYLQKYSILGDRQILVQTREGVENAVVIPALEERDSLFQTLASVAKNPPADLGRTAVICVVNNHRPSLAGGRAVADNQETLAILRCLVKKETVSVSSNINIKDDCEIIAKSGLRLAAIDASSPGREIPESAGGVGAARKIGMDAAVMILTARSRGSGIISCLDADTCVEENYLAAIASFFQKNNCPAATVGYAHQKPEDINLLSAICRYEIFLRAYVIGLSFAASPYAFPAIGSTISCTADSYIAVRGMNRRAVAEDFHFLDKLAKLGRIGLIEGTTVHPSARPSRRVAFGTGRKMLYFLEEGRAEHLIHNPDIFIFIRQWLAEIKSDPDRNAGAIMKAAKNIHPLLHEYLTLAGFPGNWESMRKNCADSEHLLRQFHVWFDGLKTLRLVHHLERSQYPPAAMFPGLKKLVKMMGKEIPHLEKMHAEIPALDVQLSVLEELRALFPAS
ncbi:MAG: hypothetical protein K0B01_05910 [Syntrophobacterales bacterium]|nr:hypothetical protein [Syntrophobacterales bacterium]